VHLIPFLEAYAWITLHPINPITLQKYREAFVTSRAKDDTQDADFLADLLLHHHAQLPVWAPQDSQTRTVQQLVVHRRAVVDERTALSNRLIALLKTVFSAGPDPLRRRSVAAVGDGVSAQMAEPLGGAKGQAGDGETVLSSPGQPERDVAGETPGVACQGRAGDGRDGGD
jgi:hypothetical protein